MELRLSRAKQIKNRRRSEADGPVRSPLLARW